MANKLSSTPSSNREAILVTKAAELLREKGLASDKFEVFRKNKDLQSELLKRIKNEGVDMQNEEMVNALEAEQKNVQRTLDHASRFQAQAAQKIEVNVKQVEPKKSFLSRPYVKWPLIIGGLGLAAYFGWPYVSKFFENWNKDIAGKAAQDRVNTRDPGVIPGETAVIDNYTRDTTVTGRGGGAADRVDRINQFIPPPSSVQAVPPMPPPPASPIQP